MNAHAHVEGYRFCDKCGCWMSACPQCHEGSARHNKRRRYRKVKPK